MGFEHRRWANARRVRVIVGLLLVVGFCVQCQRLSAVRVARAEARAAKPRVNPSAAYASIQPPASLVESFDDMVKADPLKLLKTALDRYERSIRDYTCTFEKEELVGGRMCPAQAAQVKFREKPFSVNMLWTKNADKARRVIYVENKWTDKNGQKLAIVEPEGVIARALVDYVMRPIDGAEAKKASRRQVDQFGFANSLRLIVKYCELGAGRNEMTLKYVGEGTIGGRPTYIIERRLPYAGDNGLYPDGLLVVHIDKEWLLPTCCVSYADAEGKKLLGRYVIKDARFNVGLTDADFARSPQ